MGAAVPLPGSSRLPPARSQGLRTEPPRAGQLVACAAGRLGQGCSVSQLLTGQWGAGGDAPHPPGTLAVTWLHTSVATRLQIKVECEFQEIGLVSFTVCVSGSWAAPSCIYQAQARECAAKQTLDASWFSQQQLGRTVCRTEVVQIRVRGQDALGLLQPATAPEATPALAGPSGAGTCVQTAHGSCPPLSFPPRSTASGGPGASPAARRW